VEPQSPTPVVTSQAASPPASGNAPQSQSPIPAEDDESFTRQISAKLRQATDRPASPDHHPGQSWCVTKSLSEKDQGATTPEHRDSNAFKTFRIDDEKEEEPKESALAKTSSMRVVLKKELEAQAEQLRMVIGKYPSSGKTMFGGGLKQRFFAIDGLGKGKSAGLCYWEDEESSASEDALGNIPIANIVGVEWKQDVEKGLQVKVLTNMQDKKGSIVLILKFPNVSDARSWSTNLKSFCDTFKKCSTDKSSTAKRGSVIKVSSSNTMGSDLPKSASSTALKSASSNSLGSDLVKPTTSSKLRALSPRSERKARARDPQGHEKR